MSSAAYDNQGFSSTEAKETQKRSPSQENGPTQSPREAHPQSCSPISYLRRVLGGTKLGVHILVCIFAIASWADLNSMWSELPQLVINLPEGWDLPSYIIVISQIANIGPLLFVMATILMPGSKAKLEKTTSFVIVVSDIAAVVLLSFFWDHTSYVHGKERSTALLTLNFVFALGDCTSSIAFYAYMSTLKPAYMATFFLGEGLSGMLPAFIALGQGVSDINCIQGTSVVNDTYANGTAYNKTITFEYPQFGEPGFSVQVYFLIIAGILCYSLLAFILLNTLNYCKSEMVAVEPPISQLHDIPESTESIGMETKPSHSYNSTDAIFGEASSSSKSKSSIMNHKMLQFLHVSDISCLKFTFHMTITVVINMTLTTFLASIQSYTTLPYGLDPYHMATNLAQITNPVACFFALFIMASSVSIIGLIFLLGEAGVVYIIYTAAMSPTPPLHGQYDGEVMIVGLWVAVTFLLVYAKVCVGGVMREHGRPALIWYGVFTQVGSFIGAITGYVLVNDYEVFAQAPYC